MMRFLIAGLFSLTAAAAYADTTAPSLTSVSLDDLKAKCAEVLANPQMVKPTVKITCNELSYAWVPGAPGSATLPSQLKVGAQLQMKGFQVDHSFFDIPVEGTQVSCQTFQRIERDVANVDTEISCEQLADIKDLGQFCKPIVDNAVSANPSLASEKPTGEQMNFCPNQGQQQQ